MSSLVVVWFAALLSMLVVPTRAQQCSSASVIQACALRFQECIVVAGKDVCGPCLPGFVEFASRGCMETTELTWQDFVQAYKPLYRKESNNDTTQRLANLLASVEFINEHYYLNQTSNYDLALSAFSADGPDDYRHRSGFRSFDSVDWDNNKEKNNIFFGIVQQNQQQQQQQQVPTWTPNEYLLDASPMALQLLPTIDWRERGAVTSVKHQGRCGCSWAMSLVGAIEGAAAANPDNQGYLQSLSWQQLISCNHLNHGCDGGSLVVALAYSWLDTSGGLTRNMDYPFQDFEGTTTMTCTLDNKPLAVVVKEPIIILEFESPLDFDLRVRLLKQALQVAPVSMTISTACKTLSNYRKGILTDDGDCSCSSSNCIDHAVVMVGYDDTSSPPCWILKNSWGTAWGEQGYVRISQQVKGAYGLFGVVSHAVQARWVQNVTAQVPEDNDDNNNDKLGVATQEPLDEWMIVLILFAGIAFCLCLGGILRKLLHGRDDKLTSEL